MHICTECGREDDNTRSTSLCCDCQLVLMLNLADDNQKEIARLTSEVFQLRRLGDGMAKQLKDLRAFQYEAVDRGDTAVSLRTKSIFNDADAAALGGWERASKA